MTDKVGNETAEVLVQFVVEDVLERPVTEQERAKFLALASSFFASDIVYQQFKKFVKDNINL